MRRFVFNASDLKVRRKELRKNQTDAEKLLWFHLRHGKFGVKFYRQYSVGAYILDFYCPRAKIAVELDGGQHNEGEKKIYDEYRTRYLEAVGIKVIRFWNAQILKDVKGVLEVLWREVGSGF